MYSVRIICTAILTVSLAVLYNLLQAYTIWSLWGVNAVYCPKIFEALFSEFAFDQNNYYLGMPSREEILQDLAYSRSEALILLNMFLEGWARNTHRQMSEMQYFVAMLKRFDLCLTLISFTTFADWLSIIFVDLQPLNFSSIFYEVRLGHSYGNDCVGYKTFVREGAAVFYKFLYLKTN